MNYADALAELYQAPLEQFIAERKRLVGELKAAGDKTGVRQLGTRAKPPVSAWVANQLWWHAREDFEQLMAAADKLRKGQLAASAEHRDAIAKLRKRAAQMLEQAGHGATEATLRRVAMTVSAVAAMGTWDPDAPGTLSADRDPPGFEAVGIPAEPSEEPAPKHHHAKHEPPTRAAKNDNREDNLSKDELAALREQKRAEEQAEKKRIDEERKRIAAEKHKLETALRTAKNELQDRERQAASLEKQLEDANEKVSKAEELIEEIQRKLEELKSQ